MAWKGPMTEHWLTLGITCFRNGELITATMGAWSCAAVSKPVNAAVSVQGICHPDCDDDCRNIAP